MAVGGLQDLYDLAGCKLGKFGRTRVGHRTREVEYRLLFVIERRWSGKAGRLAGVEPEAFADEVERTAARQRGRGEDARLDLFEKLFAEELGDVDGGCSEEDALAAAFLPIDVVAFALADDEVEVKARLACAFNKAFGLGAVFGKGVEDVFEIFEGAVERGMGFADRGWLGGACGSSIAKDVGLQGGAAVVLDLVKADPEML